MNGGQGVPSPGFGGAPPRRGRRDGGQQVEPGQNPGISGETERPTVAPTKLGRRWSTHVPPSLVCLRPQLVAFPNGTNDINALRTCPSLCEFCLRGVALKDRLYVVFRVATLLQRRLRGSPRAAEARRPRPSGGADGVLGRREDGGRGCRKGRSLRLYAQEGRITPSRIRPSP